MGRACRTTWAFSRTIGALRTFGSSSCNCGASTALEALPDTLSSLALGDTLSRAVSLRALEHFAGLEELSLDGHRKDIDVIGRLTNLRRLTLRGITLPDLGALRPLRNLKELELKLGGTRNLALLPEIGRLRQLDIYRVRELSDLGFLPRLTELQRLDL
jgi:hypothetical protein